MKRLKQVDEIVGKAIYGEQPVITFEFAKELTKEKTVQAYKLILSSHMYLHYNAIQDFLALHSEITPSEVKSLIDGLADTKKSRRYGFYLHAYHNPPVQKCNSESIQDS